MTSAITDRLATLAHVDHYADGEVPATPPGPYIVYYPAAARPTGRRLRGVARRTITSDLVMCVNNNPEGAIFHAQRVVDLMDGWQIISGHVVQASIPQGVPIDEPTMTDGYRWSVTVELTYYSTRSDLHV